MPRHTFLPWARPNLKDLPTETLSAALPAAVEAEVLVTLNENAPVGTKMLLDGPADVIGIDPNQINRTDPAPGTSNYESNYLPLVEFARPDFPWLFTPAAANAKQQLRPWVALAVVRKQPGVTLQRPEQQLPMLEIKSPARAADELPDLAESWAWAHAQVEGGLDAELSQILSTAPHRVCSRIVYPRPLRPNTGYYACLVPAFEAGRLAGLGLPTESVKTLEPAWKASVSSIVLPVYYVWEFSTGPGGDFESLVQLLLEPKSVAGEPPRPRMVDASEAGEGLPKPRSANDQSSFALECPLVPLGSASEWTGRFADSLTDALRAALAPAGKRGDPRVTPPVYGNAYPETPVGALEEAKSPRWLRDLNLDPRSRLGAAFGAEVVRRNQDRLVDSAWDQAGDIRAANALIRHAQAAAIAAEAMGNKHFARLSDDAKLEMTRSMHGNVTMADGQTLRAALAKSRTTAVSRAADAVTAPEFARVARARGPAFRRIAAPMARTERGFLTGVLTGHIVAEFVRRPRPTVATPEGAEEVFRTAGHARAGSAPAVAYARIPTADAASIPSGFAIFPPALPQPPGTLLHAVVLMDTPGGTEAGRRFSAALKAHQPKLAPTNPPPPPPASLTMLDMALIFREHLKPTRQFAMAVKSVLTIADKPVPMEELASVRTTPTFSEPLYAALGAISPDLVVQGFETIANNTITPLQTNSRFVEAFLTGANHEMARELFWREFPLESRSTYFKTFWDSAAGAGIAEEDIADIGSWKPDDALGSHVASGSRAVFLIRGELIRRYPTAIVYLRQCTGDDAEGRPLLGDKDLQPVIRGTVTADAAFYGFDIAPDQLTAGNGWIFVIEEPPTEPRFGYEIADRKPDGSAPDIVAEADAARTASKYRQVPVRFAIHARDLLSTHA